MNDKVIVITGASSGIGAMVSKKLGQQDYCIVLAARHLDDLKKTAEESGKNALVVVTDVTKKLDIIKLKDETLKKFGKIDVWINNAGRGINRSIMDLTEEDINTMMDVNFKSVFFSIQAIVPYFQKEGTGHIINVSSFLGRVPLASNRSAYNFAKSAVNILTANLRMDLKRTHPDIKVSLVMPGRVLTNFSKNILYGAGVPQSSSQGSGGMKCQTVDEVADLIINLIDNPKAEIYTNPVSANIAKEYFNDVEAFEDRLFK